MLLRRVFHAPQYEECIVTPGYPIVTPNHALKQRSGSATKEPRRRADFDQDTVRGALEGCPRKSERSHLALRVVPLFCVLPPIGYLRTRAGMTEANPRVSWAAGGSNAPIHQPSPRDLFPGSISGSCKRRGGLDAGNESRHDREEGVPLKKIISLGLYRSRLFRFAGLRGRALTGRRPFGLASLRSVYRSENPISSER